MIRRTLVPSHGTLLRFNEIFQERQQVEESSHTVTRSITNAQEYQPVVVLGEIQCLLIPDLPSNWVISMAIYLVDQKLVMLISALQPRSGTRKADSHMGFCFRVDDF